MEEHPVFINSKGEISSRKPPFQGILPGLLNSSTGRAQLAASMAAPLRRNLDYQGIARKIFQVEQLPSGASVIYDKDPK